jgi:poly(A) polymerase
MLDIIKKTIFKIDKFLYKKFGTEKTTKFLENIKEAQTIFALLNETGQESNIRFVGGCVRKSLLGEAIDDIDLATILEPNEVKEKLNKKNIEIIDTGIKHGTITVIIKKKKFEITTLRKDISTDGRHAEVEFTSDWQVDASRRDFTINAIYADIEGRIFDPHNGISDLKTGKINFIGSAENRIQEDYLRILRFFRFFTEYSKNDYDPHTIKSIRKYINGINKISNERIFDELKKILSLKNIYDLFSKETSKDIFLNIFPQFKYFERLKIISNLTKNLREKIDYSHILGFLIIDESNNYEYFCHKYKISNKIRQRFKNISINFKNLTNKKFYTKDSIRKLIYFLGKESSVDLLIFSLAINIKVKNLDIEELINYVNSYKIPKFPISGNTLKEYGYKSGQELGSKLKKLEEKWVENNFNIEKDFLKKNLKKVN